MLLIEIRTDCKEDYNKLREFFLYKKKLLLAEKMASMTMKIAVEENEICDLASQILSEIKLKGMISTKEATAAHPPQ